MPSLLKTPAELFDISGKVAVVTGALGAFGRVASKTLAAAGCKLVIVDKPTEKLESFASELSEQNPHITTLPIWPSSEEDCAMIVDTAVNSFGRLDTLVMASGMMHVDPIQEMPLEHFEEVMRVNVTDAWRMCKSAGRQMLEQGDGGKVVLVSSARGLLGHPNGYSAYCSAKHAVSGLVKSLGCEWGKEGICINALAPTVFRSSQTAWMFENTDEARAMRDSILTRIPMGRLGEPEDLAGPLLFLVSPASDFYTGQIMSPDGGYTAG